MAPYIISSGDKEIACYAMEQGYLLKRDDLTRIDVIDAMEYFGTIFLVHESPTPENIQTGFKYWRYALSLRLMDTEDCRPIYKTPLKSKSGQPFEWMTMDDLERIEQQPAEQKIQSFLVRLRILSSIGWSALHDQFTPLFTDFVRWALPHEGSMSAILDLIWSTFDIILRSERPHESSVLDFVKDINFELFYNFDDMSKDNPKLNSENLTKYVDLVLMTDSSHMTPDEATQQLLMLQIVSRHPELITEEIRLSLLQLVRRDGRDPFGNLLHRCCLSTSQDIALPVIRLLVEFGADLNSVNSVGDGILHILAMRPASRPIPELCSVSVPELSVATNCPTICCRISSSHSCRCIKQKNPFL